MTNLTFYYINATTGLVKVGKFDNRNRENNDDLLEELLEETDEDKKKRLAKEEEEEENNENEEDESDLEDDETEEDADDEDSEDQSGSSEDDESEDSENEEDDIQEGKRLLKEKRDKEAAEKAAQLKASQREALVQQSRNKQLTEKIREAQSLDVTDADLQAEATKEGLDFSQLDAFQKSMLKRTILAERKFSTVSEVIVEDDKVNEWADKVDSWVDENKDKPKFARLKGHEQEFRSFSMKESRRGLEFEDLARSFLFDLPASKKHKGSLLLKSGGGSGKPERKGYTEEDAIAIRKASPRKYQELVKAGKIKVEI